VKGRNSGGGSITERLEGSIAGGLVSRHLRRYQGAGSSTGLWLLLGKPASLFLYRPAQTSRSLPDQCAQLCPGALLLLRAGQWCGAVQAAW
jgi:hypothetical protein